MTEKARRHHNTDGRTQIKRGRTVDQVKRMARKLGLTYAPRASVDTHPPGPKPEGARFMGGAVRSEAKETPHV